MIAMSNNKAAGSSERDSADWNGAWTTICRLAAARHVALQEIKLDQSATLEPSDLSSAGDTLIMTNAAAKPDYAGHKSQLDRAIAEIEEASVALKSVEPRLEAWHPDTAVVGEPRKQRSVWVFIGTIWFSIALMVAGAIGAIGYLLG
jgi:hypothetical protein